MSKDLSFEEIQAYLDLINQGIDETKGGPGSGCHGDRCGRPSCDGTNCKPQRNDAKPRSGVRPSAVNPNRTEIEYTEEPSSDGRPRSGVRPPKK